MEREFLEGIAWRPEDGALSLGDDIMTEAIRTQNLTAFNNGDRYFQDVGTPEPYLAAQDPSGPTQPYLSY